ncbi:MAG: DUF968 domain-containing protein [Patescibacteria group bacterium]|nr:DUF968 domain-containing protein [Patescibacteria group bacterium]
MKRDPRQHDENHLAFIRTLPCVICQDNTSTEAAHVRMSDLRIAKPITGVSTKPHDKYTLPLCGAHHREQHKMSERVFWERAGIDPTLMALAIYSVSGDAEQAENIMFPAVNVRAAG